MSAGSFCQACSMWRDPWQPGPVHPHTHTVPSACEPAKAGGRTVADSSPSVYSVYLIVLFFSQKAELPSWVVRAETASASAHFWARGSSGLAAHHCLSQQPCEGNTFCPGLVSVPSGIMICVCRLETGKQYINVCANSHSLAHLHLTIFYLYRMCAI